MWSHVKISWKLYKYSITSSVMHPEPIYLPLQVPFFYDLYKCVLIYYQINRFIERQTSGLIGGSRLTALINCEIK